MTFNEDTTVEKEIIETLQLPELGWRYENRDSVFQKYRPSDKENEVLLVPILREKLKALNPHAITNDERADMVIDELQRLADNQEWLKWLRNEKTKKFVADENYEAITLIDYDDNPLNNNDFLVTNQFRIEGNNPRRPDIILFINGIPIIDIEAKTSSRGKVDWQEAVKQIREDYVTDIPQLYYSNAFCIAVNETRMKYGVPGTRSQDWQQWRDPSPHNHISPFDEMKCSLYGLCDRRNLLDLIRNFIVFEVNKGQTVKKIARYQQFRATNDIVERSINLDLPSDQRRGIVWHTQGSGKSLTILFAAKKLWHYPQLNQPTILIIIDREQLEDQTIGQFFSTNTENCTVAGSIDDLQTKLREDHRGVIITIINKFNGIEERISSRTNIIVLADEAHRTQYGDLGDFMRRAIPNASRFGLTGTPLELNDRNTPRAFGRELGEGEFERYMGKAYTIKDSLKDQTTVPIHLEPRLTNWKLWGRALDEKFEELYADRSEKEKAELKAEGAKLKNVLLHPQRLEQITKDIAEHFQKQIQPNRFKAILVCEDKETCAVYKAALDELLGAKTSLVIFSEDPKRDKEIVKQHYLGKSERKKAIEDFKKQKPTESEELKNQANRFKQVEILIVCDMLLTGFDAPILQVMYLDKGLKGHTLLQAIARVNRPYNELKQHGLIVDYYGVFEKLNEALNQFDLKEIGKIVFPYKKFINKFKTTIENLTKLLPEVERSGSYDSLMQILLFLNDNEEAKQQFELEFRNARILYEAIQSDECSYFYIKEYKWLCKLHIIYRKKFYPKDPFEIDQEDGAKTVDLVRESINVEEIQKDFPTYILDANYLTQIKDLEPDAKALEIETRLAAELTIRLEGDEDLRPLSQRLQEIICQKQDRTLKGIAQLEELELEKINRINQLEDLAIQTIEIIEQQQRPIADSIVKLVKERLPNISHEQAIRVANAIVSKAEFLCFPGWFKQSHMDTEIYREFTRLLNANFKDFGLHGQGKDFIDSCIKLLRKVRFCG